ncbi:MAG: 50S ribosomal protein L9 [Deltaproteobacteria bacterium]|nr:50S ribosomal protein L9 [Deltaproteobacteria bacterium]
MQVILREDIPQLGDAGAIVRVRDGYARNFLIPKGFAVRADGSNMRMLDHEQRVVSARQVRLKSGAEQVGVQIRALTLVFQREAGDEGKLFGSVTNSDIAAALAEKGVTVDRRRIRLPEAIKHVGEFLAEIKLHAEVLVPVKIRVDAVIP